MSKRLLLTGATLVTPSTQLRGDLLIENGKILAILEPRRGEWSGDVNVIDVSGKHILPGIVDLHTHIEEPGLLEKEDIISGTKAAAAGGVTTVVVMPNCHPPINSAERVLARAEAFMQKSFVDFALFGSAGGESLKQIEAQVEVGVVGFKSYIGPYREDRQGYLCQDTQDIYQVLEMSKYLDRFSAFHCGDRGTLSLLKERLKSAGRKGFDVHHASRPEFTESLSVLSVLEIARETGGHLHLVHMSSPWAIRMADLYRNNGANVTIETCPHYLTLTNEDTLKVGPYAQVDPPLRSPQIQEELWQLMAAGIIDIIATDHAPSTREEKNRVMNDLLEFGGGLPALETIWSTMLNSVSRGRITLEHLSLLMAESPARIAKIYPRKGCLLPGSDADLVVVDLDEKYQILTQHHYSKNPDAAHVYEGRTVTGRVKMVFQRGRVLSENGIIASDQSIGAQWVKPI